MGTLDNRTILVTYASEFGTTGEVAEAIAKTLCQRGATAQITPINGVRDLNKYDAVVLGSAIQYGRWMSEARAFVTAHQDTLGKLPVAYFFTCLALSKPSEKAEHEAMAYAAKLESLSAQIKPVSIGRFAGVLDYSKMALPMRLVSRLIYTIMRVHEGDYRDWDAIRSWADCVCAYLDSSKSRNATAKGQLSRTSTVRL